MEGDTRLENTIAAQNQIAGLLREGHALSIDHITAIYITHGKSPNSAIGIGEEIRNGKFERRTGVEVASVYYDIPTVRRGGRLRRRTIYYNKELDLETETDINEVRAYLRSKQDDII